MDTPTTSSINLSTLRTTKEKVYLTLFIILSLGIWGWFIFSAIRQTIALFDTTATPKSACYVRDRISGTVNRVDPELLITGEKCISWDQLSKEEQDKILDSEKDILAKIFQNLTTPILFFFFFLFTLFLHYVSIAYIRMNAVKVGVDQYREFWEMLQKLSLRFKTQTQPDMFIMLGHGMLNAFATRLVLRKFIIVTSELAEALIEAKDKKQLEAVIGHELGHHLLWHTNLFLDLFLLPIQYIPLLSLLLSRAREYSADRVMFALTGDTAVCEKVLIKLAVGKKFAETTNTEVFLKQSFEEQGFFAWFSEKISTHPHLPNRLNSIRRFAQKK